MPGGVLDAGFASLATFVVGFVAVSRLDPALLGVYALLFSAFVVAAVVPGQALLVPAEVASLQYPVAERAGLLRRSLATAAGPALLAAFGVILALVAVPADAPADAVRALLAGTVVASFLSPLQDHLRRMLHLAGRSWHAATVSVVQLGTVSAAAVLLVAAEVAPHWIPMTALAAANAVSLVAGLLLAGPQRSVSDQAFRLRNLAASGKWLLLVGLLPAGAGFLAAGLIVTLAGAEQLGYAEAARVVGQPLLVLSLGLAAVFGPRSMDAAAMGSGPAARRYARLFTLVTLAAGAGYLLLVGPAWAWSPLTWVLGTAYVVAWLVPLTIVANVCNGLAHPYRSELLGGRRERALAGVELAGSLAQVAVAASAALTQAYARPLGFLVLGVARLWGFARKRRAIYAPQPRGHAAAR